MQLLCEAAADIALQVCKSRGLGVPDSYREIFTTLAKRGILPAPLAEALAKACGMRDVLTHLYDTIDLSRVVRAVEPAVALYRDFLKWAVAQLPR